MQGKRAEMAFCGGCGNLASGSRKESAVCRERRVARVALQPLRMALSERQAEEVVYIDLMDKQMRSKPGSALSIGSRFFNRELRGIFEQIADTFRGVFGRKEKTRLPEILKLKLDDDLVLKREEEREAGTPLYNKSPLPSRIVYTVVCRLLDMFFKDRPIPRFWFLETVARMPYFAYLSVLHLYESLGWWHVSELRKIHFAEDWNELHHLLTMESLGGDSTWSDRFLASHASLVYYWVLVATYIFSPSTSYNFSELLENHAADTYKQFLEDNAERLKELPAPAIAKTYYTEGDLYLFDEFQTSRPLSSRRPKCDNLYDVFTNIYEDELEHVKTMEACSDYAKLGTFVQSPHERHYKKIGELIEPNSTMADVVNPEKSLEENKKDLMQLASKGEKSSGYKPPMFITEENKNYEEGMGL